MNIQNAIKAAFSALLIAAASQASATVVTASGLPATGTVLSNDIYHGSFDLSFLPGQYTVNSIGFTFNFADDSSDVFTTVSGGTSTAVKSKVVEYSAVLGKFIYANNISKPMTSTGESESVVLSFGSTSFTGQTIAGLTTTQTSDPVYGTPTDSNTTIKAKNGATEPCTPAELNDGKSCKDQIVYNVDVTKTVTQTTDYTGNIVLNDFLQSSLLDSLLKNKSLGFNLGVTGDLVLKGATLNIDYTDTTPPQSVPEPASLALFGIALMGVAGFRRGRRG